MVMGWFSLLLVKLICWLVFSIFLVVFVLVLVFIVICFCNMVMWVVLVL